MHQFTNEEIRMLAEAERMMDAGEMPFVVTEGGGRLMVSQLVMDELGLESGQSASPFIAVAIERAGLAALRASRAMSRNRT